MLLSGGQDSTVCLGWALRRFAWVETIGFAYGQRHAAELACRQRILEQIVRLDPAWRTRLGEDHQIDLSVLGEISDTALTRQREISLGDNGLPSTFVPGRNIVFFTFAAAVGYRRGLFNLVGGMCETDYSGYPDCRRETIDALTRTLCLGMDADFQLHTPLMRLSKAQTWALSEDIGGAEFVELIREETHTCYLGERGRRHDWGYGCGSCPACELRARGYLTYRQDA